jgi:ferredoxin-type protein NapF
MKPQNGKSDLRDSAHNIVSRRSFLKLVAYGSIMFGLGGLFKLLGKGHQLLRPPGALSEGHFRSLCLSCGKCEEICPQKVIRPVLFKDDSGSAGTPCLDFSSNYCNLCMKCTHICPTGALLPIPQKDVLIGIAKVIPERCAPWMERSCGHGCSNCCPFKAIIFDGRNRPIVKPELCMGCGICEVACSLSANEFFTKGIVVYPTGSPEPD